MLLLKSIFAAIICLFIIYSFYADAKPEQKQQKETKVKSVDYFFKGQEALGNNDYEEAIDYFGKAINSSKNNLGAYYNRGIAYLYTGKANEAIADFSEVIRLDPKYSDAFNNRGLAYSYIQELDSAKSDFDRAISLDSNFAEAYINRGSYYVVVNDNNKAMDDFNKAVSLNAKNPELYFQRARVYYKNKEYQKAIDDLNTAENFGMKNIELYTLRGNALFKLMDYIKAVRDYSKALEINPKSSDVRNNRALANEKLGFTEKADEDRNYLLELYKNNPKYPPVDSIKFRSYSDSGGIISIEMPASWHFLQRNEDDNIELIISSDSLADFNTPYSTGVSFSLNRNMQKKFNVSAVNDLLEFWEGSAGKNAGEYFKYDLHSRTSLNIGDYTGFINKVTVQPTETAMPLRAYELVLARDDILFYAYFQSLEREFAYYMKIYDKALETLKLK